MTRFKSHQLAGYLWPTRKPYEDGGIKGWSVETPYGFIVVTEEKPRALHVALEDCMEEDPSSPDARIATRRPVKPAMVTAISAMVGSASAGCKSSAPLPNYCSTPTIPMAEAQ